jgi:RNA polymerase sigma-70 factor, ECF subfamily
MDLRGTGDSHGWDALRRAVAEVLLSALPGPLPSPALAAGPAGHDARPGADERAPWLLAEALVRPQDSPGTSGDRGPGGEADLKVSSADDQDEAARLIALVDLARAGDADAFGLLYDHYHPSVYRFLYYRVGSVAVAEDLTSETFFRALRSMSSFTWQGKDFGAWLMTIARNLTMDHFKSSKTRLEMTTEDMTPHDSATESPEASVLAHLTNEALMSALKELPAEQQECIIMRFLQGLSIAETAAALGRSDGAVKQLQLRGVRNLAKLMPEGVR